MIKKKKEKNRERERGRKKQTYTQFMHHAMLWRGNGGYENKTVPKL